MYTCIHSKHNTSSPTFAVHPVVVQNRSQGQGKGDGDREHPTNPKGAPDLGLPQIILLPKLPDIRTFPSLKLEEILHSSDHSDTGVLGLLHRHGALNVQGHNSLF